MQEFPFTDYGNAQRLVAKYGNELRYCTAWGKWLVWDGTRWKPDRIGEIMQYSKEVVRQLYASASRARNDDLREKIASFARASEDERRLRSMMNLAQTEPGIPVLPEDLDANPWLLNCQNGTLDLQTGTLRAPRREDLLMMMAPVAYDPNATCPLWEGFLKRILNSDRELIGYLQRLTGYTLTGLTKEQILFILFGEGANGKTTYLEALAVALGDYAAHTPTETLLVKRGDGAIPNDVARLVGKRFVAAVETEEGRHLATAKIKQMTGGDTLCARFLHKEFFEFKPQFKILVSVNHRPIIRDTTHSIWRRIHIIPFTVQITKEEQDKELPAKLRNELSGILNWAVQGCLMWQKGGLGVPKVVEAETEQYRKEMDVLLEYLNERCQRDATAKVGVLELYTNYLEWCKHNGEKSLSRLELSQRLKEKGFDSRRSGPNGSFEWHGLGLH